MDLTKLTAARVAGIEASGIRKIFDRAATLTDPINLSIGRPDFDVSPAVQDAVCDAVRGGGNQYTPSAGIPDLKNAVKENYKTRHGFEYEQIMITSGVSGALTLSLWSIVNPGDEVILPDPYFVSYRHLTVMAGGIPVFFDTYPDYQIRLEEVEKKITPKTKAILAMSPGNPTGVCIPTETKKGLAELARRHNLIIISDEIYDRFIYGVASTAGELSTPIASFYPEGTITVGGLSKTAAMTGWRIGWACGPRVLIEAMTKLQQFTFVCAPSMAQIASVTALKEDAASYVDTYQKKRDMVVTGLQSAGYTVSAPEGAFYLFVPAPEKYPTGTAFVEAALDKNLLLVPGEVFSEQDTHFRISYAAPDEKLEKAVAIFKDLNS